ncbi:MAG: hypothetical protein ACI4EU_06535 [Butyrivibrio sp.]
MTNPISTSTIVIPLLFFEKALFFFICTPLKSLCDECHFLISCLDGIILEIPVGCVAS